MALALYRKYRPPTFADVSGQDHIKITLENELANGQIAHAYLFNGPRGTGKTTMARILAKAVNCTNRKEGESEPCNECDACKAVNESNSLEVVEIDAASNRGVDNVQKNIIDYVRVRPAKNKYRVFIIDEVHMLTSYAFNALLKTLEEPPEYVIFILATTEVHKILPTIISRCQRFDFKKLDGPVIKKRLMNLASNEGVKVHDEVLDLVIHYSEGCMRDAESLLSQILSLDSKEIGLEQAQLVLPRSDMAESFQLLEYIFTNRLEEALSLLNKLVTQGLDIEQFYKEFVSLLRQLLMLKLKVAKVLTLPANEVDKLEKLLEYISVNDLMQIINLFVMIPAQYKTTVIPQLPFEIALVSSVNKLFAKEENKVDLTQIKKNDDNSEKTSNNQVLKEKKNSEEVSSVKNSENVKADIEDNKVEKAEKLEKEKAENILNLKKKSVPDTTVTTSNNEDVVINIDLLKNRWGEVRKVLKQDNISLASLITVSAPRLKGKKISVVFRYKFNYDHIKKNPEMQDLIQKAITKVLGYSCSICFDCDASIELLEDDKYQMTETADNTNADNSEKNQTSDNSFFDILGVKNAI